MCIFQRDKMFQKIYGSLKKVNEQANTQLIRWHWNISAPPERQYCIELHTFICSRYSCVLIYGAFTFCIGVIIKKRKYLHHRPTTCHVIPKRTGANFVLKGYSMNEIVKAHLSNTAWFLLVFNPQIHCLPQPSHQSSVYQCCLQAMLPSTSSHYYSFESVLC